jgi:hypothetical protein
MIVLTDGIANRYPKCEYTGVWPDCEAACDGRHESCENDELWEVEGSGAAQDSMMYYAQLADAQDILIYSVGLGTTVDGDLLTAVAQQTGGEYFHARKADDLEAIFQEIADKIFLRLIQ